MLERKRGHLAAISSLASFRGLPLMAGYCASKSGVNALLESLRVELRPHGIGTTIVCPGWIRTPLTTSIRFHIKKMLEPLDAARRIADAIRQRREFFAFPGGGAWQVRLLRWLPRRVSDWLVAKMLKNATADQGG
jgi:short-subunit dehydrogenase